MAIYTEDDSDYRMQGDTRRVVFPIDGAVDASGVVSRAVSFFADEDVLPWVGMVKLNDGLHMYNTGPAILECLREVIPDHVGIFLDLKIFDVSATVINILKRYAEYEPEIVTVCSNVTAAGLLAVRETLPKTKIALVDTLTDMSPEECLRRYGKGPAEAIAEAVRGLEGELGEGCPVDLIVGSVNDLTYLREQFGDRYGYVCPGIRDYWMLNAGNKDHQERIAGVYDALSLGATYVVMGAQLTKGNPKVEIFPEESCDRTWAEMARFFEEQEVRK